MADNDTGETEEEYESDLDDAPLPAVRRRAAASDDEEEEEEDGKSSPRRKAGSDAESDGQGAAEAYDQDVYEDEEEEYEEYEEVYADFEQGRGVDGGLATEATAAPREAEGVKEEAEAEEEEAATAAGEEERKKDSEPYAVPTTGTFYMHDDRFQEARGRGRGRMLSNRTLWNSKEEQAWVHDRFDEMNLYDYHNGNTRSLRGHFRGRGGGPGGRTRGVTRGNFRGNRSRTQYHDGDKKYIYVPKESSSHIDHDNTKNARRVSYDNGKNRTPKLPHAHYDDADNFDVVRKESRTYYNNARSHNTPIVTHGRGSRRYQPRWTGLSSEQNNKSQNHENASSNADLGKHQSQNSNSRPEQAFPINHSFASNLNSASPPFYPSRPSDRELPIGQRRNAQPSTTSRPFSSPIGMEHASPTLQYAPILRGRASVPSVRHDSLQAEAAMKGMVSPALCSSSLASHSPFPIATNQVIRDSVQPSHRVMQQWPVQSSTQSTPRMPTQMSGPQFGSSNIVSSSAQATPTVLTEDAEICSPHGSNKITRLTVKGQHGDQGEERASFLYGRGHVLGATGAMRLTLGDQGFHGTPALLPVMQFGGQHPSGPGLPSIGMALPGFVSQQHLGLGNSEMAWLPVMTGSSGVLGATYGSPYTAMDGNYYSRSSDQASSSVSPSLMIDHPLAKNAGPGFEIGLRAKVVTGQPFTDIFTVTALEPSANNAPSQLKPPEITEVVNDELTKRQNKPRRYSEMNFGQ